MTETVMLSARVPAPLRQELKIRAAREGRTVAELVREALEELLRSRREA